MANGTNAGSLKEYFAQCRAPVVLAQERHTMAGSLATLEADLADVGWQGAWAPVLASSIFRGHDSRGFYTRCHVGSAACRPARLRLRK